METVTLFVRARYGAELMEMAWVDFIDADEPEPPDADVPELETTFLPWMMCNWIPHGWQVAPLPGQEAPPLPRQPLGLECCDHASGAIPTDVARFLLTACSEPFSFFVVEAAEPGRSLTLRDILGGREVTVIERRGSSLPPGSILYTRVITVDGVSIQFGCAPVLIPPQQHLRLLDLRDELAPDRLMTRQEQVACDDELRLAYWAIVDDLYNPVMPALSNTDGDPLQFVTLHYALDCGPDEAFAALRDLAGDEAESCLREAERAADGSLEEVSVSWARPADAAPPARGGGVTVMSTHIAAGAGAPTGPWPTTLASLRIQPGRLVVEVNSARRAAAVRAEIAARLGARARFERAEQQDPETMLAEGRARVPDDDDRRSREESERLAALPEVREHLRAMIEAHYTAWVDEPLPALRGQTPCQAVRSAAGRERVEALLRHIAAGSERDPNGGPDLAALRRRLGLDPG